MKVNIGSLVKHELFVGCIGIVVEQKSFPTGVVRNQVEWFPDNINNIAKALWLNSTELERLDSDEINILRGGCNEGR